MAIAQLVFSAIQKQGSAAELYTNSSDRQKIYAWVQNEKSKQGMHAVSYESTGALCGQVKTALCTIPKTKLSSKQIFLSVGGKEYLVAAHKTVFYQGTALYLYLKLKETVAEE